MRNFTLTREEIDLLISESPDIPDDLLLDLIRGGALLREKELAAVARNARLSGMLHGAAYGCITLYMIAVGVYLWL